MTRSVKGLLPMLLSAIFVASSAPPRRRPRRTSRLFGSDMSRPLYRSFKAIRPLLESRALRPATRPMPQILVDHLEKRFRVAERQPGLWGAFKGLVHRRHRDVHALHGVSFTIE